MSIKQMVDRTVSDLGSDGQRVFVTGLSAGGAMAAVMLATYPEVFAGGAVVAVNGATHKTYSDGTGSPVVETWSIPGMGHGQPVDPGTGAEQCGVTAPYILDVNVCAAVHITHFWGIA